MSQEKKPGGLLHGQCDSFVVATDVHYPTNVNLLWDVMRVLIREGDETFVAPRRKRPAVESAINALEHRGLDRVRAMVLAVLNVSSACRYWPSTSIGLASWFAVGAKCCSSSAFASGRLTTCIWH